MSRIRVKCAHCGRIFEAPTKRAVYCSDKCRLAAFKERKKNEKKRAQPAKLNNSQPARRFVSASDPAREMVNAMRQYGKCSREYFDALAEYELTRDPGSMATVNGVLVQDPDFTDAVMYSISETKKLTMTK